MNKEELVDKADSGPESIKISDHQMLLEKLAEYGRSDMYPLHMPGHKRRLIPKELEAICKMDITEIEGFDNLHDARDILKEAQEFAASLYGSDETAFVVNGSSAGLLAAIAATCHNGGRIMVARGCHKAVYHAIEMGQLEPVYIYPHINRKFGIFEGLSREDVEGLLDSWPEKKAAGGLSDSWPEKKAAEGLSDSWPEKKAAEGLLDSWPEKKAAGGLLDSWPEKKAVGSIALEKYGNAESIALDNCGSSFPEKMTNINAKGNALTDRKREKAAGNCHVSTGIQALVITSPTYDGVVSDVRGICEAAHEHNIPVIVDEAHGAHLHFSEYFPQSALDMGADIVIQSTHKTLPALTQTSIIHVKGKLVDRHRLGRMLSVYQTSSPSYILMGSIDGCMHMLARHGKDLYSAYTENLDKARNALSSMKKLHLFDESDMEYHGSIAYDRSKLMISTEGSGMTGSWLYRELLENYHIQMEMEAANYVLGITSVGDDAEGLARITEAFLDIDRRISRQTESNCRISPADPKTGGGRISLAAQSTCDSRINPAAQSIGDSRISPAVRSTGDGRISPAVRSTGDGRISPADHLPVLQREMSIYDAGFAECESIELENAAGRTALDYIYLYPPGVPLVTPGEIIDETCISIIKYWEKSGLEVSGVSDHGMISVVFRGGGLHNE